MPLQGVRPIAYHLDHAHLCADGLETMVKETGDAPSDRRPDMTSSLELLQRAREGDDFALNQLFERYIPILKRWARGRLPRGRQSLLETDDLVQETVLRTLKRIDKFEVRGEGALQAYLRQGLLNRIRDEIRRVGRRPEDTDVNEDLIAPGRSPLEEVIGREAIDRYEAGLERLPATDREAIIARLEMGLSYPDIARALDKPSADAARMAVSRALLRLAREIES